VCSNWDITAVSDWCGDKQQPQLLGCRDRFTAHWNTAIIGTVLQGGTGVSGPTRGLATLPIRWIQELSVVRDRDGRPQEDPLAVYCFCVCSGSALLGDLPGVSRSRERDIRLSCPRIFLCIFIVYCRVVRILSLVAFCYVFMCVGCFGLVVSTCQVIGWKNPLRTP